MLEAGKMGMRILNIESDKGEIMMAGRQSIFKNCSCCGVFLICRGQHLSNVVKEGAMVNQWQGSKNSLMHVGREGWPVWSDRTDATAAQMAVKDDAGSDRTMSVPCSWLCMELSQRPVRVPKWITIHCQKCQQWAREHQNWTTKQWKKVARSDESHFVLPHVDGRLHIHQGNTWHQDALWEAASGGGAMLYVMIYWKLWVLPSMWMLLWYVPPGQTNLIRGAPTSQLTGLKGSVSNILIPDTTAHLQGSIGIPALISQGYFGR